MNKVIAVTFTVLVLGSSAVWAQEIKAPDAAAQVQAQAPQPIEVGNKICPVSGEKVPVVGESSEMGGPVKYEYNGKIYNLCCPMCIKDFKNNPEKYSKKADEEAAKNNAVKEESETAEPEHAK